MRNKAFAAILCTAVLISNNPAYAATKITPGTKCSKVGATQIYAGKKYTCIKLGSKLYWDNGKKVSNFDALAKLPATCVISVPQWHNLSENDRPHSIEDKGFYTGTVFFSSLIVNSSLSNVATNVRITVEWYDNFGLSYKKIYRIPKVYTGATPFGFIENYSDTDRQFPTEPIDIRVSSTCSSKPITKSELVNGEFPVIKGQAPISLRIYEPSSQYPTFELTANIALTNLLKKDLVFATDQGGLGNAQIFGFIKDNLGNVLGGLTGRVPYGENNIYELAPGDSTRIDWQLLMLRPYPSDQTLIRRQTIFDYVIILD